MSRRDGLFKKIALEHDLSCIIRKNGIFFQKHDIFSLEGKQKIIFLKKYIEKLYFLYIRVTNTMLCPSAKKKEEKRSFSAKIHLKVIDILD